MRIQYFPPATGASRWNRDLLEGIKTRQRSMWASGDYAVVGGTLQIVGETLCEAADVRGGERVLDVAAGSGNAALGAARRWADVTASDYVPALLERARARAEAEGLPLKVREADAERLPFADGSFDVVMSVFGVMFAPDQDQAARELLRVCRPGGRIALANWTPDGFIGELFQVVGRHVPPPPEVRPAALWGTEERLRELFPAESAELTVARREFVFRYRSAAHWLQVFRDTYGPVHKAFEALGVPRGRDLEKDLELLLARHNRAVDGTFVASGSYLEAVILRR